MKSEQASSAQVVQHFRVPPKEVFNAFLDPQLISQWMFGAKLRDEEILNIQVDPQTGGRFSFLVRRQGKDLNHTGEYLEVSPPHRLAFTWGVEPEASKSQVVVDLVETIGGCDLILVHHLAPEWAHFAEQSAHSWSTMLGVLAEIIN